MTPAIQRRDALARTGAHETALACVEAGIEAASPERAIREALTVEGERLVVRGHGGDAAALAYDLTAFDELLVVGGGKAAGRMAAALEAVLGERIDDGTVVTNAADRTEQIAVLEGDHPVPSERTVEGTRTVLDLADRADERTLVVVAISGGASSLLTAPAVGIDLEDVRATTRALLESGATIDEINAVRKHCSAIKGGQLARRLAPATAVTLLVSDVVGDDPSTIASGPTVPDDTTFADALDVVDRYGLDLPATVARRLERGRAGEVEETPSTGDPTFERFDTVLLAGGGAAIDAARDAARERGYGSMVLSSRLRGDAREVGVVLATIAEEVRASGEPIDPPAVLLAGGETTVTVRGDGTGGPNQELALSAAVEFAAQETDAVIASVDTDGIDGATDAAGAIVDRETVGNPDEARAALDANDSFPYLDAAEALVRTGPTGTNVNDLVVLVLE